MISMSTVLSASKGELIGLPNVDLNQPVLGLCNDTRKDCIGKVYVAIAGPNFDGHSYLQKAEQAGAIAALVDSTQSYNVSIPLIKTADSVKAMGLVASEWRNQSNLSLLGITGSVGKTTLKEMSENILSISKKGIATVGNLNNDIGVPLTLSRIKAEHEYAVVEMGMSDFGEIRYLSNMAKPNVVIINNAAPAHLEGLGTVEGVANAKSEIIEGLSEDGVAILNADDTYFDLWRLKAKDKQVISFGLDGSSDITASYKVENNASVMQVTGAAGDFEVNLPVLGEHNVRNALAVIAATSQMGCSVEDIKKGLESYTPLQSRGGEQSIGNTLFIDDTYNANPASMRASINTLELRVGLLRSQGKSVKSYVVLGDMGELGDNAEKLHHEIGTSSNVDYLLCSGEFGHAYVSGFKQSKNATGKGINFKNKNELTEKLVKLLVEGSGIDQQLVLVKGSRSSEMEDVLKIVFNSSDRSQELGI